jgi:hypothetical protein
MTTAVKFIRGFFLSRNEWGLVQKEQEQNFPSEL